MGIFLSRPKASHNRAAGARTCQRHSIYCIRGRYQNEQRHRGDGASGKGKPKLWHSPCYLSLPQRTVRMWWKVIKQYLTALHGVWQTVQFPVGYRHVVLAHGSILEAPTFAIVIDKLCCFAGKEQGFLIVLRSDMKDTINICLSSEKTQCLLAVLLCNNVIVGQNNIDIWVHSSNSASSQSHWNQSSLGSQGITLTNLWCQGYHINPQSSFPPPLVSCFTIPSTTSANHWWCSLRCSAVFSYSANRLAKSVWIVQSSHTNRQWSLQCLIQLSFLMTRHIQITWVCWVP